MDLKKGDFVVITDTRYWGQIGIIHTAGTSCHLINIQDRLVIIDVSHVACYAGSNTLKKLEV